MYDDFGIAKSGRVFRFGGFVEYVYNIKKIRKVGASKIELTLLYENGETKLHIGKFESGKYRDWVINQLISLGKT